MMWIPKLPRPILRILPATILALPTSVFAEPDPPQPGTDTLSGLPASPVVQTSDSDRFKRFDALIEPGLSTRFPPVSDSIVRDAGGIRSALADHGIGISWRSNTSFTQSLLPTGQPRSPQRYNGQRFTVQNHSELVNLTADLGHIGLDRTMFIVGATLFNTTYSGNGPDALSMRALALYHRSKNDKFAIKIGYISNIYEFIGLFTGGSPVLSAGLNGLMPLQNGMSADPVAAPGVNITFNGKNGFYVKGGVQRSLSPEGRNYDIAHSNGGFRFGRRGAGPLYIGEIGIRRDAAPGQHQIWLRAGGFYNDSSYRRFDGKGTSPNSLIFGSIDYQWLQTDRSRPGSGVYVGGNVYLGPKDVGLFTRSYELRTYATGIIRGRPKDTITVRATYNDYSKPAEQARRARGETVASHQMNVSTSYSTHVRNGLYVVPSLSYLDHPSFTGAFKSAMVGSVLVYIFL